MAGSKHVVIIGGGIIGLCTAYYSLQRGHQVTVVERGSPDHDCCSLGNAGMIVPSHFVPLAAPGVVGLGLRMMLRPGSPFSIRPRPSIKLLRWLWRFYCSSNGSHVERSAPLLQDLHLASRACFEELEIELGGFGLQKNGLLMLCATERGLEEERKLVDLARRIEFASENITKSASADSGSLSHAVILSPGETARLEPGIRMTIAGSAYFPLDCHVSANRLMGVLRSAVEQGGGQFTWHASVRTWRTAGSRVESIGWNSGELAGDAFVLAAGCWSPEIVKSLGLRLPIQAGKGYSFDVPGSGPRSSMRICSILSEARVAVTPMDSGLRFAGTLELGAMDERLNRDKTRGIMGSIPRYFPEFKSSDFEFLPVWTGLRPCSPDGLPYIGRFQRYDNLYSATGHAMMGISLGPITGKLMAEIISDVAPRMDIGLLRPDRFG